MKMENDIVKIVKIKNGAVLNTHNNMVFTKRNYIRIDYRNGSFAYIDTITNKDISGVDYFKVLPHGIEKTIFEESAGWL